MRRKDREVSAEQAWEIVERCSYGVLAMTKPDGTPYAVPVNFAREGNYLYIHCAQTGEKTDCLNHQPQVCVTCVEGGAWVDQPALTTRYASAVMLGKAEELTDEADKVKGIAVAVYETGAGASQKPWRFFGVPGKDSGLAHHRGTDHRKGESGKDGMKKTVP